MLDKRLTMRLSGKTAIITGSSKGIGKEIARKFVDEGANVVTNSRSKDRAEKAANDIDPGEGNVIGIPADVSNYQHVKDLVDKTLAEFGSLDIMVNNAGITNICPANELEPPQWQEVIDVNLTGVFFGSQIAAKQMIDAGNGGAILNISSIMGEMGFNMRAPYCAAKGGVNTLTKTLAVEWAEHNITVNSLAPGFIYTDITNQTQNSAGYTDKDIQKRTPMARYGDLEEVAESALFLVSRNNFVTGEVLNADGGWTADAWRYRNERGK